MVDQRYTASLLERHVNNSCQPAEGNGSGLLSATSIFSIASTTGYDAGLSSAPSDSLLEPADAALTVRNSSAKAFMRELRKVIEQSDVIIQVLDARDPEGTRSRWVEDEVRKREGKGKKLLGVINKIGWSAAL